ncbi:gustatory and pheromone receptor 39a-like [Euwallacea similis]|uniref:gustatory and pheromone receptor 39a-like n=1 Tax=Euwallacea similis TaxID=1736056 RepID=UPI0034503A51
MKHIQKIFCSWLKIWQLKPLLIILNEDHYTMVRPILYAMTLFGLCPLRYKTMNSYYEIKYCKFLIIYSYAFFLITSAGTIWGLRRDALAGNDSPRMTDLRKRYITICDIGTILLISLLGVLTTPCRTRQLRKILEIFSSIDQKYPVTKCDKHARSSIILIFTSLAGFLGLVCVETYLHSLRYLQNYICYFVLYTNLICQTMFFWHLVFFVQIRLMRFKEELLKETVFALIVEVSSEVRLKELLDVLEKIRKCVGIINDSASFGVVFLTLSCLLHLVVTPYSLLVEILKKSPSVTIIVLQSAWLSGHIGLLLLITEPCQRCSKEYQDICNITQEVICLMELRRDLRTKHFAENLKFNACGFFNIDRSLLTSIAGAVSTYLVILFQFSGNT